MPMLMILDGNQPEPENLTPEQLERVTSALTQRFLDTGLIPPLPDEPEEQVKSADNKRKNQLSRALAAYASAHLLGLNDCDAAATVVDGRDDNGIDAIAIRGKNVYLVQAKFKTSNFSHTETLAFLRGARDLREHQFHNFRNPLFTARRSKIEKAVRAPGVQFNLIVIYLGNALQRHSTEAIADYQREKACELVDMNGTRVYEALLKDMEPEAIDAELTLQHHAVTTTNPRVAYGLVSARSLAQLLHKRKTAIFGRNIRSFLGDSNINQSIEQTLLTHPQDFAHLNNGITIVCHDFDSPGNVQGHGTYALKGLSVVNGAQTVGSMARVYTDDEDGQNKPDALVQVTIIQTAGAPEGFAEKVTRSRNTQNPVPQMAFAAQDPLHEGLRQLLAMQGIKYVYKPGAESADLKLEDVARALVNFDSDPTEALSDSLERALDVNHPIYRRAFGLDMGGSRGSPLREPERLFRRVEIFREVDKALKDRVPNFEEGEEDEGADTIFYTYMRPLARYWVIQRSQLTKKIPAILRLTKEEKLELSRDTDRYADELLEEVKVFLKHRTSEDASYSTYTLRENQADWRIILSTLAARHGIKLTTLSYSSDKISQ